MMAARLPRLFQLVALVFLLVEKHPEQLNGPGWDAGSRANPAPFFMSSKNYGSLRNTFKPGVYNFSQPVPRQ